MDQIETFLESLKISPTIRASIVVLLVLLVWVYRQNWFGLRDGINKLMKRPNEKLQPDLTLAIDIINQNYEWKGELEQLSVREIVVKIQNDMDAKITNILPYIKIEDERNNLIFNFAEHFVSKKRNFELLPKKFIAFPIFDTLVRGPMRMDIQLFGIDPLLNRKMKVTAYAEYLRPNDSQIYSTPFSTLVWSWYQPNILKQEIKLEIYEQFTNN